MQLLVTMFDIVMKRNLAILVLILGMFALYTGSGAKGHRNMDLKPLWSTHLVESKASAISPSCHSPNVNRNSLSSELMARALPCHRFLMLTLLWLMQLFRNKVSVILQSLLTVLLILITGAVTLTQPVDNLDKDTVLDSSQSQLTLSPVDGDKFEMTPGQAGFDGVLQENLTTQAACKTGCLSLPITLCGSFDFVSPDNCFFSVLMFPHLHANSKSKHYRRVPVGSEPASGSPSFQPLSDVTDTGAPHDSASTNAEMEPASGSPSFQPLSDVTDTGAPHDSASTNAEMEPASGSPSFTPLSDVTDTGAPHDSASTNAEMDSLASEEEEYIPATWLIVAICLLPVGVIGSLCLGNYLHNLDLIQEEKDRQAGVFVEKIPVDEARDLLWMDIKDRLSNLVRRRRQSMTTDNATELTTPSEQETIVS